MQDYTERVAQDLFRTEALQVAPVDQPYWYTSGTLGPYYINTHYLFGGAEQANGLLALIDECLMGDRLELPARVGGACMDQYASDADYRTLIDRAVHATVGSRGIYPDYDAISGGERRDYHFSYALAEALELPHITLFKDGAAVWTELGFTGARELGSDDLQGLRVLHVADLVTEASSYLRAWLPALRGRGAEITETLAIVDRHQGGREVLEAVGVELQALIVLDARFFEEAVAGGLMTEAQKDGILEFQQDPEAYMRAYLAKYPGFLDGELAAGGKRAERAMLAREQGWE